MVDLMAWLAYGAFMMIVGMGIEGMARANPDRPSWILRLWWDLFDRYRIARQRAEAWRRSR